MTTYSRLPTSPECLGCQIGTGQIIPPGGDIWRDNTWHLAHDAHNVIPGFLVLGTIPHVSHLIDIPEPAYLFGWQLLRVVRQIMAEQLGLPDCTLFQNDHTAGHFHLWVLPLYPEMHPFGHPPDGVMPFLRWTKEHWNTIEKTNEIERMAAILRKHMLMWRDTFADDPLYRSKVEGQNS